MHWTAEQITNLIEAITGMFGAVGTVIYALHGAKNSVPKETVHMIIAQQNAVPGVTLNSTSSDGDSSSVTTESVVPVTK